MMVVNSGVDDTHDDIAAAGLEIPRIRGIDIGVRGAAGLSSVVEAPQLCETLVIGDNIGR